MELGFKYSKIKFSDLGASLEVNSLFLHGKSIWLGLKYIILESSMVTISSHYFLSPEIERFF